MGGHKLGPPGGLPVDLRSECPWAVLMPHSALPCRGGCSITWALFGVCRGDLLQSAVGRAEAPLGPPVSERRPIQVCFIQWCNTGSGLITLSGIHGLRVVMLVSSLTWASMPRSRDSDYG